MSNVAVFCGSRAGNNPAFADQARQFTRGIIDAGYGIVYGGGGVGMMGAVADTALELGGTIIGVIPECLATAELKHPGVKDMRVVPNMHARKQLMHELSDACAVLPGGYGTMEEAFEAVTWNQLRIHHVPTGVLNCAGCYDALNALCDCMLRNGFLDESCRQLLQFRPDARELLKWLHDSLSPCTTS